MLGRRVVGVDVADGEYGGPWGVTVEEDELVVDVILVLSSKAGVFFVGKLVMYWARFPSQEEQRRLYLR